MISSVSVLVAISNYFLLNRFRLLKKALFFSAFFCACELLCATASVASNDCPPIKIHDSTRVKHVYDGDTIQLEDGRKVRLIGIDTPETFSRKHTIPADVKKQGEVAGRALRQQLAQADNRVSLMYGEQRNDHYRRTLAHVYLPDGKNLQAWLIRQGYGIAFTTPPNDRMSDCYRQLEQQAQQAKLGIWAMPRYQPKSSTQLEANSQGFHILKGRITDAWQSQSRVSLLLDGRVELRIYKNDLTNFNQYMLQNIKGKNIQVRGWLKSRSKKTNSTTPVRFSMTLRHEDSMALQK